MSALRMPQLVAHRLPPLAEGVARDLHSYDRKLRLMWDRSAERWRLVRRIEHNGIVVWPTICILECADGSPAPIDNRLLQLVWEQDIWRSKRISDFVAARDRYNAEQDASRKARWRGAMRDAKDKLRWAYRKDQSARLWG